MPVELFVCFAGQNALLCDEDVWLCINVVVYVWFCLSCHDNLVTSLANCVWWSSGAVNGSGPSASEWLALSGARLRGWLACDGFQTLDDAIRRAAKGSPESQQLARATTL